ncbi:diguanylate cyclase [Marinospirillum perlucidum]|uniref:diguanylate cyclase n=1 Tax=Marinospirillum perlucidum TaxID=1982602 RepID=UPI000DF4636C|nr:diguanylate cyclase [Marinospirillum perlucidum]
MQTFNLHWGFNRKLLFIYSCILLACLLLIGLALSTLHQNLLEDRRHKVRQLVESSVSLIDHYQQKTQHGLSLEEAQRQAQEALRNLRYGDNGYFWINDLDTRILVHPIQPQLEGSRQEHYQDSLGQFIFQDFVRLAEKQQAGYLHYYWPRPGSSQPVEKLSYIELYEPWNWVVGSGIYLDDIDAIFWREAKNYAVVLGLLLIVIGFLAWSLLHFDTRIFQSNQLMASVMEACGEAIMITDNKTRIIWANSAFQRLTGYSPAEVKGQTPQLLRSGKQQKEYYEKMWACLSQGEFWSDELINRHKSGRLYYEQMSITPVYDRSGQISHYVAIKKDISQRKKDQLKLEQRASLDSLTGLPNRRTFLERLEGLLEQPATREGVVMMLDLDHFKTINDSYGHQAGDQVLIEFARLVANHIREDDLIGRLGGEEFAVMLPGMNLQKGWALAEDLCQALQEHCIHFNDLTLEVTVSIGITAIQPRDHEVVSLLDRADRGLYLAKQAGRNQVASPEPRPQES